jgi:DNA-binding transcriptional LysR family regulator
MAGEVLIDTDCLPVARPAHFLFQRARPLTDADLRQAIEITIEAGGAIAAQAGHGKPAGPQRWQVSNHETAEKALVEGIGYGWLPRHQAQLALADGRLAQLPIAAYPPRVARFYLAWLAARPPREEGRQLAAILRSAIGAAHAAAGS